MSRKRKPATAHSQRDPHVKPGVTPAPATVADSDDDLGSTAAAVRSPLAGDSPLIGSDSLRALEKWLSARLDVIAIVAIVCAFVLRFIASLRTYLNPDEALHFVIVNQHSLSEAYQASLPQAHPPLYFVLLYFWRFLGTSEWMLRLPSVIAGSIMLWFVFRWVGLVLGRSAGFIAMFLLAFSPTLIALGAEIRGYAVLLLWMAAALYYLELALKSQSPRHMVLFSGFLYLAILTHYSAVWFTIALGIYVLLRFFWVSLPPKYVMASWALLQCGAAGLYLLLYVTHISKLRGSGLERDVIERWFQSLYYQPGTDNPLSFLVRATRGVFGFLFGPGLVALLALALFLFGVVMIVRKGSAAGTKGRREYAFATLLVFPFLMAYAAGLIRLYPYGGSRHAIYLSLFAAAGASFGLASITSRNVWPVVLSSILIVPAWNLWGAAQVQPIPDSDQRLALMTEAVDYFRSRIPAGSILMFDYQTSLMADYYLADEIHSGKYRVSQVSAWSTSADECLAEARHLSVVNGLKPSDGIWVFSAGWGRNAFFDLDHEALGIEGDGKSFGHAISVFRLPVARLFPTQVQSAAGDASAIRINAGGEAFTDSQGRAWAADSGFLGGSIFRISGQVSATSTSGLYQDERYAKSPLAYRFAVPNGPHTVVLKFAEISSEKTGQRVFHVDINGQRVLTNFDVYDTAGGSQTAVDRRFPVNVSDGNITILLTPVRSSATISAIEILSN